MSPIKEDLIYFLKNGRLENVDFGITRSELVRILGKPDFTFPENSKVPSLLEYDNVEFYFQVERKDARLIRIQIESPVSYSRKGDLIFRSYNWTIKLNIEKAIAFLKKHKIKFEEKPYPHDLDFWRHLETDSGVEILFTNQTDENTWNLHSFGKNI